MPIQYNAPISQYTNPYSVEISQALREKYLTAFSAQTELEKKLSESLAAPFVGDMAKRNQIIQDTTAQLEQFASRGDYENLTVPVARSAQEFVKSYTPIAQNYERYEAAKQAEKERLNRNEITTEQYNRWLERSKYTYDPVQGDYVPYQGVQYDEKQNPVQSSFYEHSPIAKYVNVDEEILAALNTLEREKTGGYVTSNYDTDGNLVFQVEKQGQIIERISPERVDAVVQEILNRNDVRSYLDQTAEFETFDMTPEQLQLILGEKARSQNPNISAIARDAIRGGNQKQAVKQIRQLENLTRYTNLGRKIAGPGSKYSGGESRKFDAAFTEALFGGQQTPPPAPVNPATNGALVTVPSALQGPDGKITAESLNENLKTQTQASVATVAAIRNQYGKVYESLAEFAGITPDQKRRLDGKDPDAYKNVMMQVGESLRSMTNQQLLDHANKSADPQNALSFLLEARSKFNQSSAVIRAGNDLNMAVREEVQFTPKNIFAEALSAAATSNTDAIDGTPYVRNPLSVSDYVEKIGTQTMVNTLYHARKVYGVDSTIIEREIRQSLGEFVSAEELNSAIETARGIAARGGLEGQVERSLLNKYVEARDRLETDFNTKLGTYSGGQLSMKEFQHAPGDNSKGHEASKAYVESVKGKTTTSLNVNGKVGLDGKTIPEGTIKTVTFTSAYNPDRTVSPAIAITVQAGNNTPTTHLLNYGDLYSPNDEFSNYVLGKFTGDILAEAYTYSYNNPASTLKGQPVTITRYLKDGTLTSRLYPRVGANNSFLGYDDVETEFTSNDGNVTKSKLTFQQFLFSYNTLQ